MEIVICPIIVHVFYLKRNHNFSKCLSKMLVWRLTTILTIHKSTLGQYETDNRTCNELPCTITDINILSSEVFQCYAN